MRRHWLGGPYGARGVRRLCGVAVLVAFLLAGCVPQVDNNTPAVSSTHVKPSATFVAPTPSPTAAPTPPPDPAVPFAASPLEPRGHASVMLPSAVASLEGLQDAPRYQIAATFDPGAMTLRGTERVRVVNRAEVALGEVYFRLYPNAGRLYGPARMELLRIADGSGKALAWESEGDPSVVRVPLASPWEPGGVQALTLEWQATVPVEGDRPWTREQGYGIFREAKGLIVLAEWFPMLAVHENGDWRLDPVPEWGDPAYSEIAFHEVWFAAPESYAVIATGSEVATARKGGTVTYAFRSGPARDFFIALSDELGVTVARVGDVTVRSFAYPGHAASGAEALAAATDALGVFNTRFGPYPYRELDIVEAPLIGLLGMEYPGVVLISDALYTPAEKWRLAITVAHEIAHQWWYGVVGNDILREPWLDEALATFSSGVYVQDVMGDAAFRSQYGEWVARYESGKRNGTTGAVTWPVGRFYSSWNYVTVVYYKGAIALQALRLEIGDVAFFGALRRHYEQSRFKVARGQDLLGLLEQAAGRDLDTFYRQWFAGE